MAEDTRKHFADLNKQSKKLARRTAELQRQSAQLYEDALKLQQSIPALKAEIQTGRTFAGIALDSVDPKKTARNLTNARKAYDTARAWAKKVPLSPADSKDIAEQLEVLKADLASLEKHSKNQSRR